MKQYVCFIFAIIIMQFALSAQEKDTLYNFQEYELIYSPMQLVIDKVIDTANSCPYFNLSTKNITS